MNGTPNIKMKKKNKEYIIGFLDFETAPATGLVWGVWETDVIEVLKQGYMLSASMKILGDKKIYWYGLPSFKGYKNGNDNEKKLLEKIVEFRNKCDVLVAHNGDRFDFPTLNARLIYHGMNPIEPKKTIDTLKICRNRFKFLSNKLDDIANFLGVGRKTPHTGKHLWIGCMNGNKKDWKVMEEYNNQDINLLEKVYLKLRPFITNHPNVGIIIGERSVCPNCGSKHLQSRGIHYGKRSWFCVDCRSWHSSAIKEGSQVR